MQRPAHGACLRDPVSGGGGARSTREKMADGELFTRMGRDIARSSHDIVRCNMTDAPSVPASAVLEPPAAAAWLLTAKAQARL